MRNDFDELIERRGTGCVKWDENDSDIIPLWVADMDFKAAPAIQEAVRKRAEHGVFGYTVVGDDYYDAVISWFQRRHGWTIRREEILYTTGVVPAMSVAIKALTMPGEKVLILSPDYNCFFSSIRNNGCEVLESTLRLSRNTPERFEIDWPDFEAKCADEKTTVFLLCNPHNPTGRVWIIPGVTDIRPKSFINPASQGEQTTPSKPAFLVFSASLLTLSAISPLMPNSFSWIFLSIDVNKVTAMSSGFLESVVPSIKPSYAAFIISIPPKECTFVMETLRDAIFFIAL